MDAGWRSAHFPLLAVEAVDEGPAFGFRRVDNEEQVAAVGVTPWFR